MGNQKLTILQRNWNIEGVIKNGQSCRETGNIGCKYKYKCILSIFLLHMFKNIVQSFCLLSCTTHVDICLPFYNTFVHVTCT